MEKDKIVFKGSHPDSLYRVPMGGRVGASKIVRVLRILRWPVALFTVCIALAVFVYFLMPDNFTSDVEIVNATNWQRNNANAQTRRIPVKPTRKPQEHIKHTTKGNLRAHGTKPQEIDFYDAENVRTIDLTSLMETVTEKSEKIKNHVPPVFPTHITPEVQYGNEKADVNKIRTPKLLEAANTHDDESTLKPHITQSPERPLAIYFDEGKVAASTETITRAETNNDLLHYDEKETTRIAEELSSKPYSPVYKDTSMYIRKENSKFKQQAVEPDLPHEIQSYYRLTPLNPTNRFTSGHSKLFGISIEDAEKMKSTTQSSLYNTRVSPTLPTWRDRADSTTKNYPLNVNLDVSQCRSTRLALCRGVLPYDLAGPAVTLDGVVVTQLLPQIEYLVSTNCSDRVAQFLCALLEPECSPTPYLQRMPCYNLCRAVSESCEGSIPRELSGVFGCTRYPTSGCSAPRSPCGLRELTCNDGSCIPRHWSCDGAADCPSAEDEAHCAACAANEFRCNSGGCIRTRWICDGYSDCPGGEDEAEQVCGTRGREAYDEQVAEAESEPGEESAGSAPALAVRRPYHGSDTYAEELIHRNGEGDNSKELLITSDSSNSLKRNFTRRPSASRLTPYNRPLIHDYKAVQNDKADITVKRKPSEKKITSTTPPSTTNQMLDENLRETTVSESLGTHLDKSINNLERVINGAAMLKKAPEVIPEEITDSTESKMDIVEKTEEPRSHRGTGRYEDSVRAHASPCPSGELRCVDGRCITLAQLCDGTIDCSDHADEDNCYT